CAHVLRQPEDTDAWHRPATWPEDGGNDPRCRNVLESEVHARALLAFLHRHNRCCGHVDRSGEVGRRIGSRSSEWRIGSRTRRLRTYPRAAGDERGRPSQFFDSGLPDTVPRWAFEQRSRRDDVVPGRETVDSYMPRASVVAVTWPVLAGRRRRVPFTV